VSLQLTNGGVVVLSFGGSKVSLNLSDNYTSTGSHFVNENASVASGSWSVLPQGNNANCRYSFFVNNDATSSCFIGVNGTGSYAILGPGDTASIPFSGSAVLYAQANKNALVLSYLCMEA
jgi:hypothetical protein